MTQRLKGQLDAACAMLEEAVAAAEAERQRASALEVMLVRALDGLEALEAEHTRARAALADREAALEDVLALSERGLAAAVCEREAHADVGFWRRLFGNGAAVARRA